MKIRIKDNSIRFRLTQSEVSALGNTGKITSFAEFPNQKLIYTIEKTSGSELDVSFFNNLILLAMPEIMITEWVDTDRVGFDGQSGAVKILVEKDFVCIDNTVEDQSDNYPNPNMKC